MSTTREVAKKIAWQFSNSEPDAKRLADDIDAALCQQEQKVINESVKRIRALRYSKIWTQKIVAAIREGKPQE
jgi:hypothetical protein